MTLTPNPDPDPDPNPIPNTNPNPNPIPNPIPNPDRWYKPDYIINELNINSAMWAPEHKEILPLTGKGQTYTLSGYCYNGGGRKIIRVEVSLDGGKTWTLTKLRHPETPTEYGKYWCWCFWEHEIDVQELWAKKARLGSGPGLGLA